MPPQRKHERPLTRRIQCWQRLKLETTEADRQRGVWRSVRYGRCNDICRRRDEFARQAKDRYAEHSHHWKLDVAEALIGCDRLLQATIGIDPFGAVAVVICLCERHRRGKCRDDACLTGIHQLSEQHCADQNTAQRDTQSAIRAIHGTGLNPRKLALHSRAYSIGRSSPPCYLRTRQAERMLNR